MAVDSTLLWCFIAGILSFFFLLLWLGRNSKGKRERAVPRKLVLEATNRRLDCTKQSNDDERNKSYDGNSQQKEGSTESLSEHKTTLIDLHRRPNAVNNLSEKNGRQNSIGKKSSNKIPAVSI